MITDLTGHPLGLRDRPYKIGAGDIAVHLRRRITGGELLHGERLPPERAFADQFGVSRGTVRDALRRLEEGGFVEKRPGSGTYVTWSDAETTSIAQSTSPLELIDTRYALEPQIVRLAVLNATEQALVKAERSLEAMEHSEHDADSFSVNDEAFHLALAECTRNAMLVWITKPGERGPQEHGVGEDAAAHAVGGDDPPLQRAAPGESSRRCAVATPSGAPR